MNKEQFLERVTLWDTTIEGAQTFLIDGIPASAEMWGEKTVHVFTEKISIKAPEAWFSDCRPVCKS